jgi:outer membrane biosynthesis protein TonB
VSADRPINADVPEDDRPEENVPEADEPATPAPAEAKTAEPKAPEGKVKPEGKRAERKPKSAKREERRAERESKPSEPEPEPDTPASPPPPRPRRRRQPIPGALKLVAGLVALAIAFIVLVVVAGGGGPKNETSMGAEVTSATPLVEIPPETSSAENQGEEEDEGGNAESDAAPAGGELAFPLVATDNTTRIGGASPAENAAGAALAVFPSTTAKQKPGAVVLVDEDDWPAAIAAAVLMAPPVRAPLLLSTADGLPEASEAAFAALDPQGSEATKGARAFAIGDAAVPDGATGVESIAAAGGADSAAAITRLREGLVGAPPDAFVLAPLEEPGFAAPAAAWAARSGDPVLFAKQSSLPQPTAAVLKAQSKVPVFVLGPKSAIGDGVLAEVKKIGSPVTRVAGADPVRNAIAFARFEAPGFGWGVDDPGHGFVLARADSPLDAAAAAPLSASGSWGPLLLTDSAGSLPDELRNYFLDLKPGYTDNPTRAFYNHVWVVGDQEAIDMHQQAEVNELAELAKIGGEG